MSIYFNYLKTAVYPKPNEVTFYVIYNRWFRLF